MSSGRTDNDDGGSVRDPEGRMDYRFHTLDVFTTERFGGNPLAVVLDADALTSAEMQAIAREFGLSETVFVLKSSLPANTARARICTPVSGFLRRTPTVGTAVLLAEIAAEAQWACACATHQDQALARSFSRRRSARFA